MGNEFVKVYLGSIEGMNRRGRPLARWEDRVKEYESERGVRRIGWSGQEGSAWIGRGGVEIHLLWPLPLGTLP